MPRSAPRIAWPLVEALRRLDGRDRSIADVWRDLGQVADALELPRPSYEQTRVLVHRHRAIRSLPGPGEYAVDLLTRARSPREAVDRAWEAILDTRAAQRQLEAEREWRDAG